MRETQKHQQKLDRLGQNQQHISHEPHFDRSLKDILLVPYPEYGSGIFNYPLFHNKPLDWNDRNHADSLQPYESEHLNNIKLDANTFAGYLGDLEYEITDKAFDDELKDGINIENTAAHDNTTDQDTLPRESRGRPARPCTPLSQVHHS